MITLLFFPKKMYLCISPFFIVVICLGISQLSRIPHDTFGYYNLATLILQVKTVSSNFVMMPTTGCSDRLYLGIVMPTMTHGRHQHE